jgi:hypothetical protein
MNFQRLKEFLKKEKELKNPGVTPFKLSLAETERVTDMWVQVNGQR